MSKEYITWKQIDEAVDIVYNKIPNDIKNSLRGIYGIPRGGLVAAVMLSHKLNIPIFDSPRVRPILIVDDIADTGGTLTPFKDTNDVYIATLFYHVQSITIPNYWAFTKSDRWQVYPWETK